jgi:hypothetical protein
MFVVAKKGGSEWERTSGAKVRSSWRWPHGDGLPLAVHATSASPNKVSLVTDTLLENFVDEFPGRLVGDNAYDSDPPDKELAAAGIEMIAPHRGNKKARDPGRTPAAAISPSLQSGATVRLDAKLPSPGCAI